MQTAGQLLVSAAVVVATDAVVDTVEVFGSTAAVVVVTVEVFKITTAVVVVVALATVVVVVGGPVEAAVAVAGGTVDVVFLTVDVVAFVLACTSSALVVVWCPFVVVVGGAVAPGIIMASKGVVLAPPSDPAGTAAAVDFARQRCGSSANASNDNLTSKPSDIGSVGRPPGRPSRSSRNPFPGSRCCRSRLLTSAERGAREPAGGRGAEKA